MQTQPAATCLRRFLARGYFYSETSVDARSTRRHIPEDGIFHSHRRGNLKSRIPLLLYFQGNVGYTELQALSVRIQGRGLSRVQ
jgi:hypothetical protein